MSHAFSDASDAVHATGTAISGAGKAAVQAAGSAISVASDAAVQGSVQGMQTSQKLLLPAFLRDVMPSWTAIPSTDSTSGSKLEVGSGLKLFTACLVANHGEIRRQCSLEKSRRQCSLEKGSRRNLLLTREKTSAKLEIANVIDWQNVRPLLLSGPTQFLALALALTLAPTLTQVPGDTPLIVCCWRGDFLAAKLLLDAGADVDTDSDVLSLGWQTTLAGWPVTSQPVHRPHTQT